jgi:hypothetical protein
MIAFRGATRDHESASLLLVSWQITVLPNQYQWHLRGQLVPQLEADPRICALGITSDRINKTRWSG